MASFSAFLEVGDSRYPLTYYDLFIHQQTDSLGRPASPTLGGTITVELHSPGQNDTVLTEWMLSPTRQYDGFVHLYRDDTKAKLKTISFFNAYLIDMGEHFSASGSGPMKTQLVISPQRVAVGGIVHDNNWPEASHGAGITHAGYVPEPPKPKPKPGLVGTPTFPDLPNPAKTPPITKPLPSDPVPPSRTPPNQKPPGPQIPRDWSKILRLPVAAAVFIVALLYPHNAGVANEWVAQLPPEDEERWQELEKKRKELAQRNQVLPAHEYEEWLNLDVERFPHGRDNTGPRPRKKVGKTTASTDDLMKWEVKYDPESADLICKYKQQIRKRGVESLEPIEAIEHNGKILVVDGHHRLAAAKELGISNVPVRYLSKDEFTNKARRMNRFSTPEQLERIAEQNKNKEDIEGSC